MSQGIFLILVAAIFVTCSNGHTSTQQISHLTPNPGSDAATHGGLGDSDKLTKADIKASIKERMSDPKVRLAAAHLRSMLKQNPELVKALRSNQVKEDRGFNLENPAVVKELKIVGGIAVFIIGSYVLARFISQHI
ncbi:unnamed protein product [Phytophthora fragariaefolia]|uniref:Unnamed protein product n=1 Tax=Phytophthora fragariaefolia TaxID=1490495 RepID=A0A9W7D1Y5_9STRA|nr:unnamed protein product [Phytophthora fragariaefolia]